MQRLTLLIYISMIIAALIIGYQAWNTYRQPSNEISWTTASELDTVGFNLYRSQDPSGPFERINDQLIPSSSDPLTGGSYKYVDRGVVPGVTYYYQLEDVEASGAGSRSGVQAVTARRAGGLELAACVLLAILGITGAVYTQRQRKPAPASQGRQP